MCVNSCMCDEEVCVCVCSWFYQDKHCSFFMSFHWFPSAASAVSKWTEWEDDCDEGTFSSLHMVCTVWTGTFGLWHSRHASFLTLSPTFCCSAGETSCMQLMCKHFSKLRRSAGLICLFLIHLKRLSFILLRQKMKEGTETMDVVSGRTRQSFQIYAVKSPWGSCFIY